MKKTLTLLLIIITSLVITKEVLAANVSANIHDGNVTVGDTFNVTIDFTSSDPISIYDVYVLYDANILEAVDESTANGAIRILFSDAAAPKTSKQTIKFKAKKTGTSTISIGNYEFYVNGSYEAQTINVSNGTVTVNPIVYASGNNNLSSLKVNTSYVDDTVKEVSLEPAFSYDITQYKLTVPNEVNKLVLQANCEDAKASVQTMNTELISGDNTVTIRVTAENGNTKDYVINVYKELSDQESTQDVEVEINNKVHYITSNFDEGLVPEGFEIRQVIFRNNEVYAACGLSKNIVLLYLLDENKKDGEFYIYDESRDLLYRMQNIQLQQKMYTLLKRPDNLVISNDFTATTTKIGEEDVEAYTINGTKTKLYLVYAMNWNGVEGEYIYDPDENTMQRIELYTEYFSLSKIKYDKELEKYTNDNDKLSNKNEFYLKLIVALGAVIVLIMIMYIYKVRSTYKKVNTNRANNDKIEDKDLFVSKEKEMTETFKAAEMTIESNKTDRFNETDRYEKLDETVQINETDNDDEGNNINKDNEIEETNKASEINKEIIPDDLSFMDILDDEI